MGIVVEVVRKYQIVTLDHKDDMVIKNYYLLFYVEVMIWD